MKDITIIIKTFERKKRLVALIKSIREYYPGIEIIVLDDSKRSYKEYILKRFNKRIRYIESEYDIGLSAGRNVLLNSIKTDYFVLCDDDFVFDGRSNLLLAKQLLDANKLDILGGAVYNRYCPNSLYSICWMVRRPKRIINFLKNKEDLSIYNGAYFIKNKNVVLVADRSIEKYKNNKVYRTDICSNFFIAKTSSIKRIGGWTPDYVKLGEHELFFYKAKKEKLSVGYSSSFGVRHYPQKKIMYFRHRVKEKEYFKRACDDIGLDSFVVKDKIRDEYTYNYQKVDRGNCVSDMEEK